MPPTLANGQVSHRDFGRRSVAATVDAVSGNVIGLHQEPSK